MRKGAILNATASLECLIDLENNGEYHRIIESLELEGTFKGHLVQFPRNEKGYAQLNQCNYLAQSHLRQKSNCMDRRAGFQVNVCLHLPAEVNLQSHFGLVVGFACVI